MRIMVRDRSSNLYAIKLENGQYAETGNEILSKMMRIHFSDTISGDLDATLDTTTAFISTRER